MGNVRKDRLRKREDRWVADNAVVAGSNFRWSDRGLGQSRDQLLDIANALCGGSRVSWPVTIPEL